jgi:predicted DNA-binding transcriptional regulator AlpA
MSVQRKAIEDEASSGDASEASQLIRASGLSALLDRSVRSVWRDHAANRLPQPVRIGGAVRWRRDEVVRWINAGCPDRQTWERMEASKHD